MAIVPYSIEFWVIFALTLIVVIVKLGLTLYLLNVILKKRKEGDALASWFVLSICILMFCLFLSRICFMIFDFYYTKFDMQTYYLNPNAWFWKLGNLFSFTGMIVMVFALDKKVLQFKLKGIVEILMVIGAVIFTIYPIHNMASFNVASILMIIPSCGIIVLPLIFIKIAHTSTGEIKKTANMLLIGIILFILAGFAVNAAIVNGINAAFNTSYDVYFYLIQTTMKIVGILLIGYSATKLQL
jgi:hypothetical protein